MKDRCRRTEREYYEKFNTNEFDNLDEMEKLVLERHEVPKLTKEKLDNLNRATLRRESSDLD